MIAAVKHLFSSVSLYPSIPVINEHVAGVFECTQSKEIQCNLIVFLIIVSLVTEHND